MAVGPTELLLIALLAFLLFGSRRLGDLGKGIGDGIRNFKRAIADPVTKQDETKKPLDGNAPDVAATSSPVEVVRPEIGAEKSPPNASSSTASSRDESTSNESTSNESSSNESPPKS